MRFSHRSSPYQPARLKASFLEHADVTEAIKSGDEALAQQKMCDHALFGGRVFPDLIVDGRASASGSDAVLRTTMPGMTRRVSIASDAPSADARWPC
jgi:hypothetical protein